MTRGDLRVVRVPDLHLTHQGSVLQRHHLEPPVTEAEHQEASSDLQTVNSAMASITQEDTLMASVKLQDVDITRCLCICKNYTIPGKL